MPTLTKKEVEIIAESVYSRFEDDSPNDIPNEVFTILIKMGRRDLAQDLG
jgi:hypothetical protein